MSKIIEINIDWKKKVIMIVQPINLVLEVDEAGTCIINDEMLKIKPREAYDLFEDELIELLKPEQEIQLYKCWGMALSIMLGRTADIVGIDKRLAKQIIMLAEQYGLLYQGNNYSWKIVNKDMKGRWLDKAKEKERYLKDPNTVSRVPQTPQESLDKLAKMSTPEQKAKARGEACVVEESMIVKEKEESPVEVIDDNKIYSGAAQAKAEERKRWEREVKEGGEKAKAEMNKKSSSLPACVVDMTEEYEKKRPNTDTKGQNLPKKKPLVQKSLRKK